MDSLLPAASALDTTLAVRDVLLPVVAQGAILRRPGWTRPAGRLYADGRSVRQARRLRAKYGGGPVLLKLPGRTIGLVLDPADVRRLLDETPEPFATTGNGHFQPHGVPATDPALRELNEQVLDAHQPVHRNAFGMLEVIDEELVALHATLGWTEFRAVWSRVVRRIVLGDRAGDDTELTRLLDSLRADANWAGFRRRDTGARSRFERRLKQYVERRESGSLVGDLPESLDATSQVPHWLCAFDGAGIALWRLFAVLATSPEHASSIAAEARHPDQSPLLAQAGAAVQESLRLWPTTLVVLREASSETTWTGGVAPAGTEFAIVTSVFHRDDKVLDFANRFEPEIWLDGRSDGEWPLIPFGAGPAVCPGRNLVLLTTSAATSRVVSQYDLDVDPTTRGRLTGPMPAALDHTAIRLGFWRSA